MKATRSALTVSCLSHATDNNSLEAQPWSGISWGQVVQLHVSSLNKELFESSTKVEKKIALAMDAVIRHTVVRCLKGGMQSIKNHRPLYVGSESLAPSEKPQCGYAVLVYISANVGHELCRGRYFCQVRENHGSNVVWVIIIFRICFMRLLFLDGGTSSYRCWWFSQLTCAEASV